MRINGAMRVTAAVAVGVLLFGGCSSSDDSGSGDATTTTTDGGDESTSTTKADDGASTTATTSGGVELTGKGGLDLADNAELGEILVQGGGFTVYLTTADTGSEPTCVDACAQAWPPLTGDVELGDGVDEALLGTTTRPDGSEQITYNGHPLYLFAADAAAGDTEGQGVGGVWFVVDAEGNAVEG